MNPINIFQMMRGGPQNFLQQIMSNNQVLNNPMAQNAINMAKNGDAKGIEQMARNLCKEKGVNADDVMNQIKGKLNM